MERGNAIVLIGFMGAGKSAVAPELARLTGLPVVETDEAITAGAKMTLQDYFSRHGESAFRDAETRALTTLPRKAAIIVTGGGIVLRPENCKLLRGLGQIVYLDADEETLISRLRGQTESRPLLRGANLAERIRTLLAEREPLYRELATITINTSDRSPPEVAQEIVRRVA